MEEVRVVVMGGGGVGKSALTLQFVRSIFTSTYDPTIEDTFRKTLSIDGRECAIEILDTAGTEQFMALKELYMRSGNAFILVFSLTQIGSVNELGPLREQIIRMKGIESWLVTSAIYAKSGKCHAKLAQICPDHGTTCLTMKRPPREESTSMKYSRM
ncbi:unnamed protein product [Jaminaea pallidilutea]